jgi:hypothetical protein
MSGKIAKNRQISKLADGSQDDLGSASKRPVWNQSKLMYNYH